MGGTVTINHATKTASQNEIQVDVINVDAGSMAVTSSFDGYVSLNGVLCQQWKTGYTDFPKSYWNCVNPTGPLSLDLVPTAFANGLYAPIKNLLGGPGGLGISTRMYVFIDGPQWTQFFALSSTFAAGTSATGVTGQLVSLNVHSTVFENVNLPVLGYSTLTTSQLKETTAHVIYC